MGREVVAVPTRGVERWLTQRLSHRLGARTGESDGVSANIDFPFPGTLIAATMTAVGGLGPRTHGAGGYGAGRPGTHPDPWSPERSVWPLLQLVDDHIDDPLMRPLAAHLRASSPAEPDGKPRRFTATRHLADLFDQYAVHRPAMLLAWERGREADLRSARPDDMAWQAELWRLLRRRLGVPSPAERFDAAPSRHRSGAGSPRLAVAHLAFRPHPPAFQPPQRIESSRHPQRRPSLLAPSLGGPLARSGLESAPPDGRHAQARRPYVPSTQ